MEVEINFLAVALAAVAAMIIGSTWYANSFFGKEWRKILKINKDKEKETATKSITRAIVASFVSAYILAHFIEITTTYFSDRPELSVSITTALFIWLGFYFTHMYMQDSFEQRPSKISLINSSNMLVTLFVMGLIIGLVSY